MFRQPIFYRIWILHCVEGNISGDTLSKNSFISRIQKLSRANYLSMGEISLFNFLCAPLLHMQDKSYSMEELQTMFTEMAQGFESSLSYYTTSSVVDDPAQSKGACGDSKPIMDTSGSHFGVSSCWGMYGTSSYCSWGSYRQTNDCEDGEQQKYMILLILL